MAVNIKTPSRYLCVKLGYFMSQHNAFGYSCHLLLSTSKEFALFFDDVTCIYQQEIWHEFNVNC